MKSIATQFKSTNFFQRSRMYYFEVHKVPKSYETRSRCSKNSVLTRSFASNSQTYLQYMH